MLSIHDSDAVGHMPLKPLSDAYLPKRNKLLGNTNRNVRCET